MTPLQLPFCGIQSDAAGIVKLFVESVYADCLSFAGATIGKSPFFSQKQDVLLNEAVCLAKLSESADSGWLGTAVLSLKSCFLLPRSSFPLEEIQSPQLKDSFFRLYFGKNSWSLDQRRYIMNRRCLISNISQDLIIKKTLLPICPVVRLDTTGYDIFLTHQDHMPIRVSPGTRYVVRYHDSIPILHPDLMKYANYSVKYRYAALKKTVELGAYFVCNSEQTRSELLMMFPQLNDRLSVIPPVINEFEKDQNLEMVIGLLKKRSVTGSQNIKIEWPDADFSDKFRQGGAEYIMTIAPLDPKKNIVRLIKGFYTARSSIKRDLKLIIVGSAGWKNKETLNLVLNGVKNGDIIWLQNVFQHELKTLLSHAKAFIFVSLIEGFGIPPLEAMSCGVPVISSDIPIHRWVQRDAPFYCNPYDYRDIANAIAAVCDPAQSDLCEQMIQKGKLVTQNYVPGVIKKQWESLFHE